MYDAAALIQTLSIWFLPLLFAITLHEAAHAWVSFQYGDSTAFLLGRVSLNPIKHVDPVGTIAVPLTMLLLQTPWIFGWAKPVPVNIRNIDNPRVSLALIALAGPAANFIMAFLWALAFKLGLYLYMQDNTTYALWLVQTAKVGVFFNIVLAIFNLLPIPPLDGGKVVECCLPYNLSRIYADLEPYGFLILLALIFTGVISPLIGPPIMYLSQILLNI